MSYADFRIEVLKDLHDRGYKGVSEFLYSSMSSLMQHAESRLARLE